MRAAVDHAALTEPMAVGLHSVRKAGVMPPDAPLVIGCGPVGVAARTSRAFLARAR